MTKNPPEGMPQCCPNLFYNDLNEAIRFLKEAFAMSERCVVRSKNGTIEHAQLSYRGAVVMLSPANSPHAIRPCATPKETGKLVGGTYLFVDDVDAHLRQARKAGAEVIMNATDMPYGDRVYCALDTEGHFWAFATHMNDPAPRP
jgi:uncharacterized glyoxalase superfamily protein PhnB